METFQHEFEIIPCNMPQLQILCGEHNSNLNYIEQQLNIEILSRGPHFRVQGKNTGILSYTQTIIESLYAQAKQSSSLSKSDIHLLIHEVLQNVLPHHPPACDHISDQKLQLRARTKNQVILLKSVSKYDINFCIGPAGTGKSYLSVASAVHALHSGQVKRIVLTRPAVEAGEKLGFLPGDLAAKVDPYLRPLYDALHESMGAKQVAKCLESNTIEIAPLAYMRGRTLNESFIIIDEAQNTTPEQMKMFLTRIGHDSKAMINGDITQIDLPNNQPSGLTHAIDILKDIDTISFTYLTRADVLRHPLVQLIIDAYENA